MTTEEVDVNEKIDNGEYTMFDKFLYGGIGYGYMCLPKNLFTVILSVLFPPFGIILKHLQLQDTAPYITLDGLLNLVNNLHDVAYSVLLTFCFWVPGVIYSIQQLKVFSNEVEDKKERFKETYGFSSDDIDENDIKKIMQDKKMRKQLNL